jgi:hypothetical protein
MLKSLILKLVKNVKSQCGDAAAQHLVCVRAFCVKKYAGLQHTPDFMLPHHHIDILHSQQVLKSVTLTRNIRVS